MKLENDDLMQKIDCLFERIKREAILYNRNDELEIFLEKYEFETTNSRKVFYENAKILIIGLGGNSIKSKDINGIFKNARLKDRFDIVHYEEATNYDIRKLEHTNVYSDVFIGAVPHKMKGMGDESSALLKLEKGSEDIYPKIHVLRKENGEYGITKRSLNEAIANSVLYEYVSNL